MRRKLFGFSDRRAREAFDEYREAVADLAANSMGSARGAREAMNVVFGAYTGAIVTDEWPRKSDLAYMNDVLCDVIMKFGHGGEKSSPKPAPRRSPARSDVKGAPRKSKKNNSEIPASTRHGGRKAI